MKFEDNRSGFDDEYEAKKFVGNLTGWVFTYCLFLGVAYLMGNTVIGLFLFAYVWGVYKVLKAVTDPFHKDNKNK